MKRILLAVDGSDHSARAAQTAGEISAGLDIPVDVVHVVSDLINVSAPAIDGYAHIEQIAIQQRDLLKAIGAESVQQTAERVRDAGGKVEGVEVLVGSPAHEIVRYADDHNADCIVMGRRGLGNVTGLLMGSVSHKVGHLTGRTLVTTE
jgi:nucleotide-binding universal stress UspA family protein